MGLAERRKIAELRETTMPARSLEIEAICGLAIPYEVDWSSFEQDAEALNFLDNVVCHRVNMALRVICSDPLGQEAVRDGLHCIRVHNVADPAQRSIASDDGVLKMHGAYALRLDGAHDDHAIQRCLLAGL